MTRSPRRPGVLHFVERWLPLSESFVHATVTNVHRPGVVVSARPPENVDLFPGVPIVAVGRVVDRFSGPTRRRLMTAALLALASRHRCGILHVHHGYRAYEVVGAARRGGMPLIVSLHGHDVTGYAWARPGIYDGVLDRADAVIVPSAFLADHAASLGVPAARVHVIPSGVDTAWFSPSPLPDGPPEVVFVGRFVEKKGLDTLVAAWPSVVAAVPEARLSILGYGPLEALARSGGPGVSVELRPDRHGVRRALRRCRAVVTPSRTADDDAVESLLLVNLEAQAAGRPVVTTRHGGIPEFVREGETALVVPEADAPALADALVRVLTDDQLARRLAEAGPAWAAAFDVRRCAARVDELYDSVASGPRLAPAS